MPHFLSPLQPHLLHFVFFSSSVFFYPPTEFSAVSLCVCMWECVSVCGTLLHEKQIDLHRGRAHTHRSIFILFTLLLLFCCLCGVCDVCSLTMPLPSAHSVRNSFSHSHTQHSAIHKSTFYSSFSHAPPAHAASFLFTHCTALFVVPSHTLHSHCTLHMLF